MTTRTCLAALIATAACGLTPAAAWARDSAEGGANNTAGFFQIGLAAHSDNLGGDPNGNVSARSRPQSGFPAPFKFGGRVTCLKVVGNRASIKYRFDRSDNPFLLGGGIEIFVEDNGQPSTQATMDGAANGAPMPQALFEASGPARCDDPTLAPYQPVDHGNFTVTDG
jgi:hypothetical protein